MNRFIVISGCSGGGKSSLLTELARRGFATVQEPGRRIVREESDSGGAALPWTDAAAFARRAIDMALDDIEKAESLDGPVFFDRGLIDAAAALQHVTGKPVLEHLTLRRRYHSQVFFTPPWRELYRTDPERKHDFVAATAEYERLLAAYPLLGYRIISLPKASIVERADFVLSAIRIEGENA